MENQTAPRKKMFVDGKWVESVTRATIEIENPAHRGSVLASVPRANAEDVDIAVNAAARAFRKWRRVPTRERGAALFKIADYIERNFEDFARTNSSETGSAIRTQSRREIRSATDIYRYFAGLVSELKGTTHPVDDDVLLYTQREPYGVVGAIVPFNDPMVLSAVKIAPALAAGNTIVLKAPEDAPLGTLSLCQAFEQFLPPGVVNVITGYGEECGQPLADHPLVNKIAFTGSTEVGKLIMHSAANRIVPVSLELGGKSPQIVFPDSDSDKVAEGVIEAIRFSRQGQSCSSGERLFVHSDIYDSFVERLVRKVDALTVGDPLDEDTYMGAINNGRQFAKVCDFIELGVRDSKMRLLCGGPTAEDSLLSEGYYVRPTLFGCEGNDSPLLDQEIFGPVMPIIKWNDEDEVIEAANNSRYGLSAFVWARDVSTALRVANRLDAGWVQINSGHGPRVGTPFGGYKQSGIGREFSLESMLDSYSQMKSIEINFK
ncbi:Gamma-glutamyl-gamma-aminobutyraldehyde dehydrogenase OS=Castellaniella defragrans OX=75697 GN=HNR28_001159 PE=4 SV=1 [Castellaniella defragrans]